jgi:hypothetical protein
MAGREKKRRKKNPKPKAKRRGSPHAKRKAARLAARQEENKKKARARVFSLDRTKGGDNLGKMCPLCRGCRDRPPVLMGGTGARKSRDFPGRPFRAGRGLTRWKIRRSPPMAPSPSPPGHASCLPKKFRNSEKKALDIPGKAGNLGKCCRLRSVAPATVRSSTRSGGEVAPMSWTGSPDILTERSERRPRLDRLDLEEMEPRALPVQPGRRPPCAGVQGQGRALQLIHFCYFPQFCLTAQKPGVYSYLDSQRPCNLL